MAINLFPFQTKVLAQAADSLKTMREAKREVGQNSSLLIQMPCGMGKTVVLSALIRNELSNSVSLVVTPGKGGLAQQTHSVLARELKGTGIDIILIGEGTPPPHQPKPGTVIVTNYERVIVKDKETLEYKSKVSKDGEETNLWDMIEFLRNVNTELVCIIDEAHYGSHASIGRIGEFFTEVALRYGSVPLRIETTATPKKKTPVGLEQYTVEAKDFEGVKEGLLRKRLILNAGRAELEPEIQKDFISLGKPEMAEDADAVFTELAYRKWKEVDTVVNTDGGQTYNPLMLFCVSNGDKGANETDTIKKVLGRHGITEAAGTLRVHTSDDSLGFEEQKALRKPKSPVVALIFKQSLALGWDCPRAQVMMITREVSRVERTFTDQLLGRIRRQVGGHSQDIEVLDMGYIFSTCDAVTITAESGTEVDDPDAHCVADHEQLTLWKSLGMRRTLISRKGRAGSGSDAVGSPQITAMLEQRAVSGKLRGDASKYLREVAGEQDVWVGKTVDLDDLSDAYRSVLAADIQNHLKDRFGPKGVSIKGKMAETALEPFVTYVRDHCLDDQGNALGDNVEAHILCDIEVDWFGTCGKIVDALAADIVAALAVAERNGYVESEYMPYEPVGTRYRPVDDIVAATRGHRLTKYNGKLLASHLYGTPVRSLNNGTEQAFEDEYLSRLANRDDSPLMSWFRNEPRLDSYGKAFSLAYKVGDQYASSQMFPDYMLLLRRTDGSLVPVAIEVKGTDHNDPTDRGNRDVLNGKAQRLSEITSPDENRYGPRADTPDKSKKGGVVYGRGPTIGAMVYRNKGDWCVYGQGALEELSVWLKRQGVAL